MLLTQLEYFDALARERHFGRAAASCHITTSTMSEAIRKLEAELDVPLVNRGKSSFQSLTAEGELLLGHARRIIADQRRLIEDLTAAGGNLETILRLGVIPSGDARAAAFVARLTAAHPGIRVEMTTGMAAADLVDRLHSHALDAAIVHPVEAVQGTPRRDSLEVTPLAPLRFGVVLTSGLLDTLGPVAAEIADRGMITGRELQRLPLALLRRGMRARAVFDELARESGLAVTPTVESDAASSLVVLAATGHWAAVVPEDEPEAVGDGSWAPAQTPAQTPAPAQTLALRLEMPVVELPCAVVRLAARPVSRLARAVDAAATAIDTGTDVRG